MDKEKTLKPITRLPRLLVVLAFLAAGLAACSGAGRATTAPAGLEPTAALPTATIPLEPTPVAEATAEPDECVACHTDQARLTETADPVVETESESTGVG